MALVDLLLPRMSGSVGLQLVVVLLVLVALFLVINSWTSIPNPPDVPLIREPPGATRFSLRTRLAYYTDYQNILQEAYNDYYKVGKPVILPGVGVRSDVILPKSSMRWLLAQPDDVLSGAAATVDFTYIYYALGTDAPLLDPWQGMLVKQLTVVLESIAEGLNEDLMVAFDKYFGKDTNTWKEVELFTVLRNVIAQAASRFTVGLPLCRDQGYLDASFGFVDAAVAHTAVCSFIPTPLLPVLGRLSGYQMTHYVRKTKKFLEPLLRERLKTLQHDKDDPKHDEPLDHLQLMLRFAQKKKQEELNDLDLLIKRVNVSNFGSYHQTALQTTNLLLNIIGSNDRFNTVATLRDEVAQVFGDSSHSPAWNTRNVAKMVKADSVMRETLRLQTMGTRQVVRKVVVDGGVVTDTGVRLPKGCSVGFLGQPAHYDDDIYDDALDFDPFRFSRVREEAAAEQDKDGGTSGAQKVGTASAFVSTSPDYLPFGTGRHACPGRFLVDFELKMISTYVLTHYDVKFPDAYGGVRPPNQRMGEVHFPPSDVKIMVKRRSH